MMALIFTVLALLIIGVIIVSIAAALGALLKGKGLLRQIHDTTIYGEPFPEDYDDDEEVIE